MLLITPAAARGSRYGRQPVGMRGVCSLMNRAGVGGRGGVGNVVEAKNGKIVRMKDPPSHKPGAAEARVAELRGKIKSGKGTPKDAVEYLKLTL